MIAVSTSESRSADIGARARMIRRRRGLSLQATAELAGISKGYLSLLERGGKRFERRSLLENLANALGCSVVDLTGEPYVPLDRAGAEALATVPGVRLALNDYSAEERPNIAAQPLDALLDWCDQASADRDQARYHTAGRDLGTLLVPRPCS